jgi:hypothetical protein
MVHLGLGLQPLQEYLTVQMVRFFYKAAAQQKAKVLRKVKEGGLARG